MTSDQLYDYIVEQCGSPEEALKRMIDTTIAYQENEKEGTEMHPLIGIANLALEMGWHLVLDKGEGHVEGIIVGTQKFIEKYAGNQYTRQQMIFILGYQLGKLMKAGIIDPKLVPTTKELSNQVLDEIDEDPTLLDVLNKNLQS